MAHQPDRCTWYNEKKRRYCRFVAKPGTKFCGNHMPGIKRVPCPFNPNHCVAENELQTHLRKCPDRIKKDKAESSPHFKEGINEGSGKDADLPAFGVNGSQRLTDRRVAYALSLGRDGLADLISKVTKAWDDTHAKSLPPERICLPCACEPFMKKDGERPFSLKHAQQQASIVGNMQEEGLAERLSTAAVLEFGAGRGYLTSMIADTTAATNLVMIDRSPFRFKAERSLKKDAANTVTRVKCDIKDFDPKGVPVLWHDNQQGLAAISPEHPSVQNGSAKPKPWVAVGKHLCGAATDFTIRCAQRHMANKSGRTDPACVGLAVATCCHHRCTWRHYVAQDFFAGRGFSPEEFELVSWMTGWALCGHEAPAGHGGTEVADTEQDCKDPANSAEGKQAEEGVALQMSGKQTISRKRDAEKLDASEDKRCNQQQQKTATDKKEKAEDSIKQKTPGWWLTRDERIVIGQKCKALIDFGRRLWIHGELGNDSQAKLVKYIPPNVSGENTLLLVTPACPT